MPIGARFPLVVDGKEVGALRLRGLFAFLAVAALLSALPPALGALRELPGASAPLFTSYRQIPGVTDEERAAVEALQSRVDVFTYGILTGTEAFIAEDGNVGGFARLFCEWMSELFGIPFEPRLYEWSDLVAGLEDGSVDFTGELTADEGRTNPADPAVRPYYMTDAIAERALVMIRLYGGTPLFDIMAARAPRYAFFGGTTTINAVAAATPGPYESVYIDSYEEAHALLVSGAIDAYIGENTDEAGFDIYGDTVTEMYYPLVYTPVSLSTKNPDLRPVISVMQKALYGGADRHLTELYNAGEYEYKKHKLFTRFTAGELAYLRDAGAVGVAAEYDNYPMSFYNAYDKEFQGIAIDVMREITAFTGLAFELRNGSGAEWADILAMLERGEAAMITELIRTPEREGRFLWPESSILTDYYALLSKTEYRNIRANEILYMTVGIVDGYAQAEVFRNWFPDHKHTVTYDNYASAFGALGRGEIELVMASQNQLLVQTNYHELPDYKANIVFDYPFDSTFGFNINEDTLCAVIDKTLRAVDTKSIAEQWTRKTYDYRVKLAQTQRLWLAGASALLLCVVGLLVYIFRKKRHEGKRLQTLVDERTTELEAQKEEARAANASKSIFLATMSHEIRTPMTAIIGMTAIGIKTSDIARKDYALAKIESSSQHLMGVINDILDMSKIEAHKLELSETEFEFEGLLQRVMDLIAPRAEEKRQRLTRDTDAAIPPVLIGDDQHLAQVITNFLSNAVKFTPEEGSVTLGARLLGEEGGVCVLRVWVTDTGIGISPEEQDRLFRSYEQARADTSRKYGGTGLGLAISKSIIELMGGHVELESAPGEGSTFAFTFKARRGAEGASTFTKTLGNEGAGEVFEGCRILLAEDVDINREIVLAIAEPLLLKVDCVENGAQALIMFERAPEDYDMILMDLQMPQMDGFEATRRIRALECEKAKTVPIIAMTANVFREDIEKCLETGMNGHIGKPFDPGEFFEALRRFLPAR